MEQTTKILLTILGVQTDQEGVSNEIKFMTNGELTYSADITRLTYQESEIVGTEGANTIIEMSDGAIKVVREGEYETNFFFRKGHKCLSVYKTPYGTIELGAYPTDVSYGIREGEGEIDLCYDLDMQGKFLGKNHLHVAWTGHQ